MKIIVNGREITVSGDTMSYDEVANIAGIDPEYTPTITYHCIIKNGQIDLEYNGIMENKTRVGVREGMIFNVVITGDA